MSKLSKAVNEMNEKNELQLDKVVENFMGGDSYKLNPLETLKMVSASSIFGEPSYYRDSSNAPSGIFRINETLKDFIILDEKYDCKKTDEIFVELIDAALDYDFAATIEYANILRHKFNMRLNPQIIMVRAAIHPKRTEYTALHPGAFNTTNQSVMSRPDEPMTQMAYYLYNNEGKKNNIPSILKRSWNEKLSGLTRYNIAKYKNHEIGMINAVRISHASSPIIDELMRNGTIEVSEDQKTWENLKSQGMGWKDIFYTIDMGHMALLRNVRGVFESLEDDDYDFCNEYLEKLKSGVKYGRQFPFRYYAALKAVKESNKIRHKAIILDCLEECMDIAISNVPKLKGKTMCLSDNSGSAWGAFNSEYGSNKIAEIDNLSSVMTAMCSDEGYVGKFGDKLKVIPVSKRNGMLSQANSISENNYADVGGHTEGGIWEFFKKAIDNKEHWDNIFIYSDQQAGHGGLYGTSEQGKEYEKRGFCFKRSYFGAGGYINVFKLIQEYRKKVNPKVNVFSVQTAGYDNVLIPEMAYRTAILYGWTGKEAAFADEYIRQWNDIENKDKN